MSTYILLNVHNDFNGFNQLVKLYEDHKDDIFETINLEIREWFDANLCAVLGGILDKIKSDGLNDVHFSYIQRSRYDIQTILQKNQFLLFYGYAPVYDSNHTTIEYKKLNPTDSRYFNQYLEEKLLNRSVFPKMSDAVHEKISESIQEMFVNARMHSETEFIYTCGQFHPARNELNFTIVDTGIGFSRRIEKDFGMPISAKHAIEWALIDGHTTKKGVSGGLGLAILKEFITQNKGKMQIISGNALYELSHVGENVHILDYYYDGSIINMTFKTDDYTTYRFANEVENIDYDLF